MSCVARRLDGILNYELSADPRDGLRMVWSQKRGEGRCRT